MSDLTVVSTSRASAEVTDIALRETSITRLVFRPMLVDNAGNSEASVKGTFVFQRKGAAQSWQDIPAEPLSSLKKGEGYKLALDSHETLTLFNSLGALYKLYAQNGIPIGEAEFVLARGALASLEDMSDDHLRAFMEANSSAGSSLIARLLAWAATSSDVETLVRLLEGLGNKALTTLNTAVSVRALKEGLEAWRDHRSEAKEEFWQELISSRSFLLEQLFSWPCTVISDKAYVGGKTVDNTGGNIVDFLVRNKLTASAALVEIKTPMTALTGNDYRHGIPSISKELSGAVIQILSYRSSLTETYKNMRESPSEYEVFEPPCAIVIGNTKELDTSSKRRSFELFRRQLRGVEIIAFDELFARVEHLMLLIGGTGEESVAKQELEDLL